MSPSDAVGRQPLSLSPIKESKPTMGIKADVFRVMFLFLLNVTVISISATTLLLLLLDHVKFENKAVRYNPNRQAPPYDSLAWAMTVDQFRNYFNNVPDVHLNVSNDQMTDFWFLPPGTRMSPLMQSIARCRMVADVKWVNAEMCNRVPVGWPWVAMIVAMINIVDIMIVLVGHIKRMVKDDDATKIQHLCRSLSHMVSWAVLFGVVYFVPANRDNHIGMLYTLPGEIYPQPYYAFPTCWFDTLLLCFVGSSLKVIECFYLLICLSCKWCSKMKQRLDKTKKLVETSVSSSGQKKVGHSSLRSSMIKQKKEDMGGLAVQ